MASQFSQVDGVLNIYFVVPAKHGSNADCSEDMWEAFSKCQENDMTPEWIDEEQCSKLKPTKTDIFVLEEFKGQLFEKLQTTKCLIVGPRCLLRCFITGEPVPPGTSPVLTTAMKDLVVCVSGFSPEIKKEIQKQVEYMGGLYIKHLTNCITHLVTDSVMSAKYAKATESGIAVFSREWVSAVWEANLTDFVAATDPIFDKYKCSVFMDLVVTSTNLPKRQKTEVKKLIEENGGEFMGPLDGTKVKVVVAQEFTSLSDKIKYAMQNNIPCLRAEWVKKSVDAGYALPFNDYLISPTPKNLSSTPEKGSQATQAPLDFSTISNIPNENNHNFVDETVASTMSSTVDMGAERNTPRYIPVLGKLELRDAKNAGPFLDGCNIYLAGFSTQHREKINRILNVGSATRLDDISDALTHVLVGDPGKASNELKIVQCKGLHPHILTIEWLEESIRLKKPAPEETYLLENKGRMSTKTTEPPPSPLSKRSLQLLQKPKRPPVPLFDVEKEAPEDDEPNIINIVQQYLRKTHQVNKSVQNNPPENSTLLEDANKSRVPSKSSGTSNMQDTESNEHGNDSEIPLSQSGTMNEQIFEGLTFRVAGFDEEEGSIVLANITGLGGCVVSNSFAGIPDYGIVPLAGAPFKHTVGEVVSKLFIEDCIDNEKLVEIMYYHRPLSVPEDIKPLANCVIATSSYMGVERTYLASLAVALGAYHQDSFARRTNIEKGQYGGTHLVCTSPKGNKYNAAVKWKLPAVTAEWLRVCAEKRQLVDETPYLVGETVAPERDPLNANTSMGPPLAPTPRQILTPKRHLSQTPGMETPIINKHLHVAQNSNGKSPFHFATPQSPYGQIFKPNPSPETRKCWAQWIDGLPDPVEPPLKRRAPSTPLSELKRQLWSAMRKPLQPEDQQGEQLSYHNGNENPVDHLHDEDEEEPDKTETRINRQLTFEDEDSPAKNELDEQLEQMDKVLRATSSTSAETRYSLHGENGKTYEEPDPGDNYRIPATQSESVGWEEPRTVAKNGGGKALHDVDEEDEPVNVSPTKRKFMLSGLRDRTGYVDVIIKLGGEISMENNFDISATHLICVRPQRNEKMLGSIAAGKWILHCSYIRGCEEAGEFIDEEEYEWGNPRSKVIIPGLDNDLERSLAAAAYRWRNTLKNESKGAFKDMVAMLMVPKEKHEQFERLICAGGGDVVQMKPPYNFSSTGKKVTHCFIQVNKLEQPVDWAMLASKGILCFIPQHLNQHLTATEPINPRECVIPEFKKYLALLPK